MTERRETDRSNSRKRDSGEQTSAKWDASGERIAKYLARCGIASRREVESLISEGLVAVNGKVLDTPAFKVTGRERITVRGRPVRPPEPTRVWRYHKPAGLVTTTSDPEGRSTVFEQLPRHLPRVLTVGRLDLTTEGLLLLTNDGEMARRLELPATGLKRIYRARAHGTVTTEALQKLAAGVEVDGEKFGAIEVVMERQTGTNNWLRVTLSEGKNREVRRALDAVGLMVNRLIRVSYGPFELSDLPPGAVEEIDEFVWRQALGLTGEKRDKRVRARREKPKTIREELGPRSGKGRSDRRGPPRAGKKKGPPSGGSGQRPKSRSGWSPTDADE